MNGEHGLVVFAHAPDDPSMEGCERVEVTHEGYVGGLATLGVLNVMVIISERAAGLEWFPHLLVCGKIEQKIGLSKIHKCDGRGQCRW